jgi:CheY-like chemotaxis protein/anti-anti-sigma regulatory factor
MPETANRLRVLYVEDEPLPRWTGGKLLESLGAHVLTAESCGQAEELWQGNALDLVVCDCRLGDGMATDLVARMRLAGHEEPVVCLTGEAEDLSEEDRARLGLKAVLRKPLEAETMAALLAGARPVAGPVAPVPAVSSSVEPSAWHPPVWVSPIWGLRAAPGSGAGHWVATPGTEGDVWVAAFGCADAHSQEAAAARRLGETIGHLGRVLPGSAPAGAMLAAVCAALAQGVDPDHDWNLEILHLHAVGISAAASGLAGLRVWVASDAGPWQPLGLDQAGDAIHPARRLLATVRDAGDPEAVWSALGAGQVERVGGATPAMPLALGFWLRSPSRSLAWVETDRAGEALANSLDRLEEVLERDGVAPDTARQAACGLLDLAEWGGQGRLAIAWRPSGGVEISLQGAPPPPREFVRFFTSIQAGTEGAVLAVAPDMGAHAGTPVQAQRAVRAWGGRAPERVGRFAVAPLPRLVTEAEAAALAERYRSERWLALDCSEVRQIGSRGLAVWSALAAERRATGRLCVTNYSGLLGRLFRRLGLNQDLELTPAHEELEAAGRRLTTASERASLLDSIVGGPAV